MKPTQSRAKAQAKAEQSFDWLAAAVVGICLLHWLASLSPSVWTWGLDYWSEIPQWSQYALLLLLAAVIVPGVPERIARVFERRSWTPAAGWAALGLAVVIFVAFRSRGFSYGDGYSFRGHFASASLPSLTGNLALMSGDLVVHWVAYRAAVMPLGGSIDLAYALVSVLAGAAALVAVARLAHRLYPDDRGARWTLIAAAFSSGMAVQWFGYVEAYTLVGAALLWCVVFLIEGKTRWAWGAWAAACVLHFLAIAFLPVLVVSIWPGRKTVLWKGATATLIFAGAIALGAIASIVLSAMRPGILVPIFPTADTTYTAFSLAHLSDTVNLLLFAAPLGLLGLLVWRRRVGKDASGESPGENAITYLAVGSASLWLFSFWVDPLIGMFRDWDLLGVFGVPFSLLGAHLLIRPSQPLAGVRPQWVVVAVLAIAHTGVFVASIQDESRAMERVDRLVQEDVHYSRRFYRGERLASWSQNLSMLLDRHDLAVVHARKRAEWQPNDAAAFRNLGAIYWHLQQYDSASAAYRRAVELVPTNAVALRELGLTCIQNNDHACVRDVFERLVELNDTSEFDRQTLVLSYLQMGEPEKAVAFLEKAISREPDKPGNYYQLGLVAEQVNDTDAAIAHFEEAMARNSVDDDLYIRLSQHYQRRGQIAEALRVSEQWRSQLPGSALSYFTCGTSYIVMERYEEANAAFRRVLELSPTSMLAAYYLATTYRHLNQLDKAWEFARRAATLDTTSGLPYLEMVYLAADAGDRAAAVTATRELLARSPADSGMEYLQQFIEP